MAIVTEPAEGALAFLGEELGDAAAVANLHSAMTEATAALARLGAPIVPDDSAPLLAALCDGPQARWAARLL